MSEEYDFNPNYMLAVVLWEKHVNFLKKPDGGFYSSAPITVRRPLKFCTDKGESWWSRFFGNIAFNYGRGSLYGGDNDGNRVGSAAYEGDCLADGEKFG